MSSHLVFADAASESGINILITLLVVGAVVAILAVVFVAQQRDPERERRMAVRRAMLGGAPRPAPDSEDEQPPTGSAGR